MASTFDSNSARASVVSVALPTARSPATLGARAHAVGTAVTSTDSRHPNESLAVFMVSRKCRTILTATLKVGDSGFLPRDDPLDNRESADKVVTIGD